MVHIYEKVNKTDDNVYGIKEITDENPLKTGPCIITILALPVFLEDVNGFLKYIAPLVNPDINSHYDPDRRLFGFDSHTCPHLKHLHFIGFAARSYSDKATINGLTDFSFSTNSCCV